MHYGPAVVAAGSLYSACCRLSAHEGAADSVLKSTLFGMEEYFTAEQQVGPAPFHHVPRSGFAYLTTSLSYVGLLVARLPAGLADSPLVARAFALRHRRRCSDRASPKSTAYISPTTLIPHRLLDTRAMQLPPSPSHQWAPRKLFSPRSCRQGGGDFYVPTVPMAAQVCEPLDFSIRPYRNFRAPDNQQQAA